MDDVRIIHGDCREVMAGMEAGSVDHVVTDPPYNTTQAAWDCAVPLEPLWAQIRRVLRPGGVVLMTASQPFTSRLVLSNPEWFRYEWIWEKSVGTGFLDAKRRPLKCHESVLVFCDGQPKYRPQKWKGPKTHARKANPHGRGTEIYGSHIATRSDTSGDKYPRSVIYFEKHTSNESDHPAQKPVPLLQYLLQTYTDEDELIFDPFAGSGSTLVACLKSGRRGIGIELDAKYIPTIERRVSEARTPLFA